MIVYHGSTEIVKKPDVQHSYRTLDFGRGFYVTTVREQAERWARRKADILGANKAIVNIYRMHDDTNGFYVKLFEEDLIEWIDFVCRCRDGEKDYQKCLIIRCLFKFCVKQSRSCLPEISFLHPLFPSGTIPLTNKMKGILSLFNFIGNCETPLRLLTLHK